MQSHTNPAESLAGRRTFLKSAGTLAAGLYLAGTESPAGAQAPAAAKSEKLAVMGGPKAVTAPAATPPAGRCTVRRRRRPCWPWSVIPTTPRWPCWRTNGRSITRFPTPSRYCNGTSALTTMFFALNLPPGSEIMVPSYTFFATIVPMRLFGLVPVFVDINPRTLNFDLEDAKRRLTKNTKAVLPVHWIGLPAEMDHICDLGQGEGADRAGRFLPRPRRVAQRQADGHLGRNGGLQFPGHQAAARHRRRHGQLSERRSITSAARPSAITTCPRPSPPTAEYRQYYGSGPGPEAPHASHGRGPGALPTPRAEEPQCGRGGPGPPAQRSAGATARAVTNKQRPDRHGPAVLCLEHAVHRRGQGRHVAGGLREGPCGRRRAGRRRSSTRSSTSSRSIGRRNGGITCPRSPTCPAPSRPTRRPSACRTSPPSSPSWWTSTSRRSRRFGRTGRSWHRAFPLRSPCSYAKRAACGLAGRAPSLATEPIHLLSAPRKL